MFLLLLFSSQNFNIQSIAERKISFPLNPPQKLITDYSARQDTSLRSLHLPFLSLYSLSHPSNKNLTTLLGILMSFFFMNPIIIFNPLIKFPNQGPVLGQYVAVNTLPYLEYIVSLNPSVPAPYKLSHYVGAFLMESHFMWSVCLPFINDNLRVLQSKLIPTLSVSG